MNDVRSRLTECMAAAFPSLARDAIGRASRDTVPEWDSMAMLTVLSLVEEEFGIAVTPENLQHFASFEGMVAYLESLKE